MSINKILKWFYLKITSNLLLFIFISIFLIVEIFIFNKITLLYFVDVYKYLDISIEIAQTGDFFSYTSRGFPFIWLLSVIFKISYPLGIDIIFMSKIIMLLINFLLFSTIYLTLKHIFNQYCAFFSVLFIMIDPSFIEYSLIAYLEPFTFLMGWLAFYLIIQFFLSNKKKFFIFGIIFSLISGFTRFEMFIIFTIPLILISIYRNVLLKKELKKTLIFLITLISLIIIFIPFFFSYYETITRFDIFTRIILGITDKEVIINVFFSISSLSDNLYLNLIFDVIWRIGLIIFVIGIIRKYNNQKSSKILSHLFYILILFMVLIITISFYGYTYKIINGQIIIIPIMGARFLMLSRSFLIPIFIYGIYKLSSTFSLKFIFFYKKYIINIYKRLRSSKVDIKDFNTKLITFYISISIMFSSCIFYFPFMWNKGIEKVSYNNLVMKTFKDTGDWLESVLNENEFVFLPSEYIFYVNNPALKPLDLNYNIVWEKAGVIYKADITDEELKVVRTTLIDMIKNNSQIKYLVIDWMTTMKYIFNLDIADDLLNLTFIVHTETVQSESYNPSIIVYETY